MLETIVLMVRFVTANGPEEYQGKVFSDMAECVRASGQWMTLMFEIDPEHYKPGYAVCVLQEQL